MKLSVNWLRELVDFPDDLDEVLERLTLLGLEVEDVQEFRITYPGVIVAEVLEATQHPDADKLRVCRVHTGSEELQIVCGAPNVRAGLRVALATVGAVLPGDFRIKKSKIRGQASMGMICSERELDLGEGHDGILELDESYEIGRALDDYFGYRDTVFEIEVTPDRPDWLSHVGVARELAAWYGGDLRLPDAGADVEVAAADAEWTVRIEDGQACPRFTAQLVDGVEVGPSPRWMRQRLLAIGQRPINCVVDASNYVLHECGHPNHCFDRAKLTGDGLHIRRAREGELFTTLDGTERRLGSEHLLVADDDGGVALAGIMGGQNSEVDESSRDLVLEVAVFDPLVVRRGRRAVGLSTDASYRFERGVDRTNVPWVSRRLATLIEEVGGGKAHRILVDVEGTPATQTQAIAVRPSQVARLLGVSMPVSTMIDHLRKLSIEAHEEDGALMVQGPSFRHDLHLEVDVIEELARMHGFDRFDPGARLPLITNATRSEEERWSTKLRQGLAARGYHECVTTSFQKVGDDDALGRSVDAVRVLNPVVQGEDALRTSVLPELCRVVARNLRHGWTGPIRLFEIGRIFVPAGEVLPAERNLLQLAWAGPAHTPHPDDPSRPVDLLDAAGELDSIFAQLGLALRRREGADRPWLRNGSAIDLVVDDQIVGELGELSPRTARALDVEATVLVATVELETLAANKRGVVRCKPISAFPPARRDLSLVVPRSVLWEQIAESFTRNLEGLLESVDLFDVYEGEGLPPGTRAMGVRIALRSPKGTLKDKRVDRLVAKLLDDLRSSHAIELR